MNKGTLIRHKGQLIGFLCFLFVGIIAENDKKIEPQDTKQVMNTVLFVQQQKGIQDAVHTLAKVMEDGKLAVEFKTVDEAVKTITDLANFRKLDVDYYQMFKDAVEVGLKQKGLTLSYAQLCDDKTTRAPRPTPTTALDMPEAAPGVDQIIYVAVNETMKRLSQSGSLALRWLTVKDGGLFWGPVTFKDMVHMEDDLHVLGSVEIDKDLTVHRNTLLGDQDADTIGIHGIATINTTGVATTAIGSNAGGIVTLDAASTSTINIGVNANPNILIGTGDIVTNMDQVISIGIGAISGTGSPTKTVNIATGTNTTGVRTMNIGTEQASVDNDTVVKVNSWRSNVIREHPYETSLDAGAGEPNGLMIIRGSINSDGTVASGSGFTCLKTLTSTYTITFANPETPFSKAPMIVATAKSSGGSMRYAAIGSATTSACVIYTYTQAGTTAIAASFDFIVIGPRATSIS